VRALLVFVACYAPTIPDGIYQCTDSAHTCPESMVCNSCKLCVHPGSGLDAGACVSCGRIVQCSLDNQCKYGDDACTSACISEGTPVAKDLASAVLACVRRACPGRCLFPALPDCGNCMINSVRGPNSPAGPCDPPGDFACGRCVPEYSACTADRSGN